MSIFEDNVQAMRNMDLKLSFDVLKRAPLYPDIHVKPTPDGVWVNNGTAACYVNSTYDIDAEYRWILQDIDPNVRFLIFLGPVSCNTMKMVKKYLKNLYGMICIEASSQLFKTVLRREKLLDIVKSAGKIKVYVYCNSPVEEAVKLAYNTVPRGNAVAIAMSPNYQHLFADYYDEFSKKFVETRRLGTLIGITSILSRNNFIKNTIRNYCFSAVNAVALKSLLSGKAAIIVGAGPSLKKNMALLGEAADKALIFACGSSIPTLRQQGLKPHFNVVYEAGDNSLYLKDEFFCDVPLLFGNQVHPNSLDTYKGPKVNMITDTDDLSIHFFKEDVGDVIVKSGPSVVNIAHDFLCKMGCSPIIFIGQDMCMYQGALHAVDERIIGGTEVTYKGDIKQKDIYGNEVETLAGYWAIKEFMEGVCADYPHIQFINATEGGLGLKGVANEKLHDVLDDIACLPVNFAQEIQLALLDDRNFIGRRIERLQKQDFQGQLAATKLTVHKILGYVEELNEYRKEMKNRSKIKQLITRIERQNKELECNLFYTEVVQESLRGTLDMIWGRHLKDCESNIFEVKVDAIIQQSSAMMGEILSFCLHLEQWVQQAIADEGIESTN